MPQSRLLVVLMLLASLTFVGSAFAQKPAGATAFTLNVDYFSNANTKGAPDGTLRVINPGATYSNLCADIFVFDTNEEMSECCSCTVTPDGQLTLSVNSDLTANPLTGVALTNGVIKVVSAATSGGSCPVPSAKVSPTPTLRAWTTHIQGSSSNYSVTETTSQEALLSTGELAALQSQCNGIVQDGSGHGICAQKYGSICNN
jgi:hypothetical protein